MKFQSGLWSILRVTLFQKSYKHDAVFVCIKLKVEIESRSTLEKKKVWNFNKISIVVWTMEFPLMYH